MTVEETVLTALGKISLEQDVSIIYAAESGSRAWGFASNDSDYDVRFIYAHHRNWYSAVDTCGRRDVIDGVEFDAGKLELDISGWDLRKAMLLFRKGNPPLLEWLNSPIVYVNRYGFAPALRQLADNWMNKSAIVMHYVHMALGNWRKYLKGNLGIGPPKEVLLKKYLYVIRPLCAVIYLTEMELRHQVPYPLVPPVDFVTLLDTIQLPKEVDLEVRGLVLAKKAGEELGLGPRLPVLDEWITSMEEWGNAEMERSACLPPIEEINKVFREMLEVVV
jgi:predicted nucleotidyltransferase